MKSLMLALATLVSSQMLQAASLVCSSPWDSNTVVRAEIKPHTTKVKLDKVFGYEVEAHSLGKTGAIVILAQSKGLLISSANVNKVANLRFETSTGVKEYFTSGETNVESTYGFKVEMDNFFGQPVVIATKGSLRVSSAGIDGNIANLRFEKGHEVKEYFCSIE